MATPSPNRRPPDGAAPMVLPQLVLHPFLRLIPTLTNLLRTAQDCRAIPPGAPNRLNSEAEDTGRYLGSRPL